MAGKSSQNTKIIRHGVRFIESHTFAYTVHEDDKLGYGFYALL